MKTSDDRKTKAQLIEELDHLRRRADGDVRDLLDLSPLPYLSVDDRTHILTVNRAWQEMLGYAEDEVVGRPVGDYMTPDSRVTHRERFSRYLHEGQARDVELSFVRRDGTPVIVSLDSRLEAVDGGFRTHTILHDVTARRRAEVELAAGEARFRNLFSSSSDGIVYVNEEGVILDANGAFAAILGRETAELPGRSIREFSAGNNGDGDRLSFRDVATGNDGCSEYEKEYLHADGHLVPVNVRCWFFRDEAGGIQGAWAVVTDLTRERSAMRAQRLYRLLAENTGDVIWTLDNELRFTYVSPSIAELRGYEPETVLGRSVLDFVTPASRAGIEKAYWKLVADEAKGDGRAEPSLNEAELVLKDGSTLWVEVVVRIVYDKERGRVGFMGTTRDISKRKRMELQIRDSERSLRALFEATADAMGLLSRDGTVLTLNRSMAQLLRLDPARAVGRAVLDQLSGVMRETWGEAFAGAVSTGAPATLQQSYRGRVLDAALYPVPDEAGQVTKVAAYVKDVTERIQTEQALEQRAAQYRRIVETVNEGIMGLDAGRRVTYVNRRTAEFMGHSVGDMLGSPVSRFLLPEEQDVQEARFLGSGEGGPDRFECRFLREDGEVVWGLVSAAPLREENGEFIGVFTMIADITESKRAEARLRESEARYRNIFEHSVEGLYQSTPDGRFLSVNPSMARLLGYDSPAEAIDSIRNISSQLYVDVEARERMVEVLLREGVLFDHEVLLRRRDGEVIWAKENARIIPGDDGEPVLYEGSMVDITERKRAEEALRLTQFSVDVAPINIFWVDAEGRLVYVNEAAVRNLGYDREELLAMHVADVDTELHAADWGTHWQERRGRGIRCFETVHRRKDGSRFPVGITSHHRQYGGREFLFTYAYDLTDRNRVEEELRRSQELLNEVQRISRTGGWEFDLAANTLHWTEGQYRLHGAEVEGDGLNLEVFLNRFIHPDDRAKMSGVFSRIIREKRPVEVEYRPNLPGPGETILVGKAIPEIDATGVVWRIYGSTRDVTMERRAARNLQQSHERLLTILDAIDADIYVSTLNGEVVLFMNAHMREAFSAAPEEMPCQDMFRKEPGEAAPNPASYLLDARGDPVETVIRERYNPRTGRWYLDHDRAIRWLGGEMVHMHMSADITELKNMAENLRVAMSEAKAASLAKNEFLANMSHEIRTPLNGLLGMLQILQLSELDEEQRDYLDTAVDSGRNLLQILNDILDLSKVESGKLELESRPFELGEILESVVSVFRYQVEGRGIAIAWHIDESMPRHFTADKGRLRQILFNLVGNASKFTEHGRIDVEAFPLPNRTADGRTRLFFSVSDTGIGIPEDKMNTVFDPFTQVDGSSTRKYQGTGLGLGIVNRLVTLMGGSVSMSSEIGAGTTVAFTLAAGDASVKEAVARIVSGPDGSRGFHILVAEDERINRAVVQQLLGRLGHHVVCVENGEKALEALKAERFDCVLMDIQMPGLDGLAATRAIRDELRLDLPVVALTAHAMKGDRDRFLSAGMNGYVSKPFELPELEAELHRVMAEHRT